MEQGFVQTAHMAKKKLIVETSQISKKKGASKAAGVNVIEAYLGTLETTPGVYRMINSASDVLYVGKAKNLKK